MRFSQRIGVTQVNDLVQLDDMDADLTNRLWSVIQFVLNEKYSRYRKYGQPNQETLTVETISKNIWFSFLKKPIDEMKGCDPNISYSGYHLIRHWYFAAEWYEKYELVEYYVKCLGEVQPEWQRNAIDVFNIVLEEENSGYRIVGEEVAPISDKVEVQTVSDGITCEFKSAREHIQNALQLISQKPEPDYPNAVKEAISACESAAKEHAGDSNATLGQAIKNIDLHPALREGISKLYGYTSDQGRIRHGKPDETREVTYADAKLMLVICSGFVNFLSIKSE